MALAKLCHVHFPATKLAAERLLKLGEEKKNLFVGAPQLDDINLKKIIKTKKLNINSKNIDLKEKYLVVLQHPVFKDSKNYHNLFKRL